MKVYSDVVDMYDNYDLRKSLFFHKNQDDSYSFKGNYNGLGTNALFGGITTAEIYLIQAECNVRLDFIESALNGINTLLLNRYSAGYFAPILITEQDQLLKIVLKERRKELVFRGLRWSDLRRLNKDSRFSETLSRELNGITYSLPPNDPRYVFPIPKYVSTITY
ncbi:RagB/SusD family nutrient uptake outer membrane protein [Sphingobacterium sp. KU25419]|nr:RagB/SusD family nutrient uptake outer membrane protein [Sphingobacterium sp. KU25419]